MNSDAFLQGYLECAIWSSTDESDDSGGEPLDKNYDVNAFTKKALESAELECAAFIKAAKHWLDAVGCTAESAGHDFWLTRNGHGVGFWDRDYGDDGDRLSDVATSFGERHIYVNRKRLHFS